MDLDNIPVSQLASLAKLPPDQQGEALLRAEEIAQERGKKRSNREVLEVVREFKGDDKPQQPSTDRLGSNEAEVEDSPEEHESFTPSPIEIDMNEICIALISNVEFLSSDQVGAVLRSLLPRISKEIFVGWSSEELNNWRKFNQ